MTPVPLIELLGMSAGAVMLFSSVPQLIANLKNPEAARHQNPARNALQMFGNMIWLFYGFLKGALALQITATLGILMAATLLVQVIYSRRTFRWNERKYFD